VLRKGIFIFLLAVLFGVVYPGIAAYFAGVFSEDDVRRTIQLNPRPDLQKTLTKLTDHETHQRTIANELQKLETYLATLEPNPSNLAQVEGALSLHKALQNQKHEPPIILGSFYTIPIYKNSTLLLWPAMYMFLRWLIFIIPPP
jgi:hypothetical protein